MDRPLIVSYGMGVDSTAMLIGLHQRGIRPDLVLFADTRGEKRETYAHLAHMNRWLESVGFPAVTTVEYQVKDFKNWPPYRGLEENCLTNGTLPSEAFGFGSCSSKWKQTPQNRYAESWAPAVECWARGERVLKAIGFDASPADCKRAVAAKKTFRVKGDDPRYEYWYPLQEWGWDRARCIAEIRKAGLPVPPKSSCFFCPNMGKDEVRALTPEKLARIVVMEARAKPRLEKIQGLWRNGCKGTRGGEKKPGTMTAFIREEGLLPAETVALLAERAPKELIRRNEAFAKGLEVEAWDPFMDRVLAEAGIERESEVKIDRVIL